MFGAGPLTIILYPRGRLLSFQAWTPPPPATVRSPRRGGRRDRSPPFRLQDITHESMLVNVPFHS